MPKPQRDRLLQRGVWLLVVGVFTSWLLGLGLIFIFAAAVCGFVGLFRERVWKSGLLVVSAIVLGLFSAHIAAIAGIYTFNSLKEKRAPESASVSTSAAKHRK